MKSNRRLPAMLLIALVAAAAIASAIGTGSHAAASGAAVRPLDDSAALVSAASSPPSEAACNAIGRRCFAPAAMANAYNYAGLHAAGHNGQGITIAVVDSFGANTIRQDLAVFDTGFNLPHMCGEGNLPESSAGNCASGVPGPHFNIITIQGDPEAKPTGGGNGTGQEDHSAWDTEVALDVEWAHATAPLANIDLVTTPTAETLGVQGLQQMMNAEQSLIDSHQVDVISQSFGAGEGSFHNGSAALNQLRQTFVDAQANHVSVFASSGDGGTTNSMKEPVKNPATIPYQSVIWPASDPLVTATGGTYLCVNGSTGLGIDNVSPPGGCHAWPGDREPGWVDSGGGYSTWFNRPAYQNVLPTGSSYVGSSPGAPGPNSQMRGVPDVSWESSATTGPLIYSGEAGGWFVIGGTSAASPQWAGVAALADEIAGHDLGFLNPALYAIGANPSQYAADFYDPTHNSNQEPGSSIPGWPASQGWDAVTGLGTPNVANLIPDLIAHSN
ncbi:MAG TPA: S53 family peptidase [Gaiellaceae bacterium]